MLAAQVQSKRMDSVYRCGVSDPEMLTALPAQKIHQCSCCCCLHSHRCKLKKLTVVTVWSQQQRHIPPIYQQKWTKSEFNFCTVKMTTNFPLFLEYMWGADHCECLHWFRVVNKSKQICAICIIYHMSWHKLQKCQCPISFYKTIICDINLLQNFTFKEHFRFSTKIKQFFNNRQRAEPWASEERDKKEWMAWFKGCSPRKFCHFVYSNAVYMGLILLYFYYFIWTDWDFIC